MKNDGISSIYNSNKILHKNWSRKGKTKKIIVSKEEDIKKFAEKSRTSKSKRLKLTERLRLRIVKLEETVELLQQKLEKLENK